MPSLSKTDWYEVANRQGSIDFKKYENWLRCMNLTRAVYLLDLFGESHTAVYVRMANKPEPCMKLMTEAGAMACNPAFLSVRPRNIWCSFMGGPKHKLSVRSSFLNYVVDQVYQNIVREGTKATDDKIIAALNHKPTLLLTGPK
jgi:hypothetical protein